MYVSAFAFSDRWSCAIVCGAPPSAAVRGARLAPLRAATGVLRAARARSVRLAVVCLHVATERAVIVQLRLDVPPHAQGSAGRSRRARGERVKLHTLG